MSSFFTNIAKKNDSDLTILIMEVVRIFDLLPYYEQKYKPKDDVIASKETGNGSNTASGNTVKWPITSVTAPGPGCSAGR